MKCSQVLLLAVVLLEGCATLSVQDSYSVHSPVHELVTMIDKMKAKIEADAKWEQKSYDKFACWCEETMERKAADIAKAKARIEILIQLVAKVSMEIGVASAEVKKDKQDIIDIKASIKASVDLRSKEHGVYLEGRSEAEQYMGALEAAINVMSKASEAKSGFLETLQETQVVSAAAGLKDVLKGAQSLAGVSEEDLDTVRCFVDAPEKFLRQQKQDQGGLIAALQLNRNPFGDYAPKGGQVQGILKEMYDNYARSLERTGGEEAMAQKSHLKLLETKEAELKLVVEDLERVNLKHAELIERRSGYHAELDALKLQLKADVKFFEETKDSCKEKATIWSTRCRLRTGEIMGINKALEILRSPEAQKTFQGASTTLLQLASRSRTSRRSADPSDAFQRFSEMDTSDAYSRLRALAAKYDNLALAQIAVTMKTGGHFDKIIGLVDQMVAMLRKEAQNDIEHRDRCQAGIGKNKNDLADTNTAIAKAKEALEIAEDKATKTTQDINAIVSEIEETNKEVKERKELRDAEGMQFKQGLRLDADSSALMGKAITAMSSWYQGEGKGSSKDFELLQGEPEEKTPEYTVDKDKAPETNFGSDYASSGGRSKGIVSIMEMLKEGFEKEMKVSRKEDAEAQEKYEADISAMEAMLGTQEETKVTLDKALHELEDEIIALNAKIDSKGTEKGLLTKMGKALDGDCSWVETHFDSRAEKRQDEIEGLLEAKNILAGAS